MQPRQFVVMFVALSLSMLHNNRIDFAPLRGAGPRYRSAGHAGVIWHSNETAMSIDLQTTMREDYAEISCRGTYDRDTLLDAIDRALAIGEEEGAETVVIDIRNIHLEGPPPGTMERYYLGEMAAKIQQKHGKPIFLAIVGKEPLIDPGTKGNKGVRPLFLGTKGSDPFS